jgi:hypothetical protein
MTSIGVDWVTLKSTQELLKFVADPPFSERVLIEAARSELGKRSVAIPGLRVGGWLLWFCLSSVLVGPLDLIRNRLMTNLHETAVLQDRPYFELWDGFTIIVILVGIYVWMKGRYSIWALRVRFAIALLLAASGAISKIAPPGWALLSVTMVLIWWLYFRRSRRVLWTLGRNI